MFAPDIFIFSARISLSSAVVIAIAAAMFDDEEYDEAERQRWTQLMMEGGSYTTCSILAKGGMGAAFKVSMAHDRSERCVKIAQDEHAEALKED